MSGDVPERLVTSAAAGWASGRLGDTGAALRRVVAAVLEDATADDLEALAPQAVAEVRARALREAAQAPIPQHLLGHGQPSVRHWLHDMADRADAEGGPR